MLIQWIIMMKKVIRYVVINVHLKLIVIVSNVLMMIQMEHVQILCI